MFKTIALIFLCCAAFAAEAAAQNPKSAALVQADKLRAEVVRLSDEKKFFDAAAPAKELADILEKELGAQDFETAKALGNLGFILAQIGDFASDKPLERALTAYRAQTKLSKEDAAAAAQIAETLGFVKYKQFQADAAAANYEIALKLREQALGVDTLETVTALWSLANIYQSNDELDKAREYFRRAYEIRAKNLGIRNGYTNDAERRYRCAANKTNKKKEAELLFEQYEKGAIETAATKPISGGVVNGKAVFLHKPSYPLVARRQRASGTVKVTVTINETGKVIFACAESGPSILQPVSEQSAYLSTFTPTLIGGKPVKVIGVIVYNFYES